MGGQTRSKGFSIYGYELYDTEELIPRRKMFLFPHGSTHTQPTKRQSFHLSVLFVTAVIIVISLSQSQVSRKSIGYAAAAYQGRYVCLL